MFSSGQQSYRRRWYENHQGQISNFAEQSWQDWWMERNHCWLWFILLCWFCFPLSYYSVNTQVNCKLKCSGLIVSLFFSWLIDIWFLISIDDYVSPSFGNCRFTFIFLVVDVIGKFIKIKSVALIAMFRKVLFGT